ncbi:transcription initiation factor IID, 18kD subunit-domain-containing protein [Aspergillus multicolor]|uniref:putative transcription initiation factor TFIID subunit 13 n=1 Tax=Aspergillus multicolor TaxID=41759 RepID=UPI003CCE3408
MSVTNRSHRRRAALFTAALQDPALAITSNRIARLPPTQSDAVPSQQSYGLSGGSTRTLGSGNAPRGLAPWPWKSRQINTLISAGYQPAFEPSAACNISEEDETGSKIKKKMAEPRARAARHKGQMNFPSELRLLLLAYGDPAPHPSFPSEPLPETVRVLDEIVTDFVLEMCHGAAQHANYSRRQKIKVDDFRFALRRDPNKLGRVQELLRMERELKEARKQFDQNDDQVGNLKDTTGKKGLEDLDDDGKKSKGKGKRGVRRNSDATEDASTVKKRKV